jgi:hypothetical protein
VRQVVAGVDHQVGLPAGQVAQPGLFAALTGPHVQVGQMQHPQRRRSRGQHRHGRFAQDECVALDEGRIADPGHERAGGDGGCLLGYRGGDMVAAYCPSCAVPLLGRSGWAHAHYDLTVAAVAADRAPAR